MQAQAMKKQDEILTLQEVAAYLKLTDKSIYRLALVMVEDDQAGEPVYVREYDFGQPGFAQTSATYPLSSLIREGSRPT